MLLPTTWCPSCRDDVVVYRTLPDGADAESPLELRCVDCDARLDRFGARPELAERAVKDLEGMGYTNLDRPAPVGPGGCFTTRGCEGCPKIDSRPW
jgi:hypothetical protein